MIFAVTSGEALFTIVADPRTHITSALKSTKMVIECEGRRRGTGHHESSSNISLSRIKWVSGISSGCEEHIYSGTAGPGLRLVHRDLSGDSDRRCRIYIIW